MFQKIILIVAINTYERTFKVAPSAPQRIAENNSLVVLDRDISFTLPCNFFPFVDFVFSSCVLFRLYTVFHVERTIAKDHEPPKKLKLSFRFRSFLPMCIYDTLEIPRAVASIKVVALRAKKIERQRARERERETERYLARRGGGLFLRVDTSTGVRGFRTVEGEAGKRERRRKRRTEERGRIPRRNLTHG